MNNNSNENYIIYNNKFRKKAEVHHIMSFLKSKNKRINIYIKILK